MGALDCYTGGDAATGPSEADSGEEEAPGKDRRTRVLYFLARNAAKEPATASAAAATAAAAAAAAAAWGRVGNGRCTRARESSPAAGSPILRVCI